MNDQLQWIISLVILVLVGGAVWRGGAANPVGTGKLLHDVNNLRTQVKALEPLREEFRPIRHNTANLAAKVQGIEHQLGKMPTTEALMDFEREVESRIATVEEKVEHVATSAELALLRGEVSTMQELIRHVCKQNDRTDESVVRIEQHLLGQTGRNRR